MSSKYIGAEKASDNPIDPASRFFGVDPIVYKAMTPGETEYNTQKSKRLRDILKCEELPKGRIKK
jgi:hypothetical protein